MPAYMWRGLTREENDFFNMLFESGYTALCVHRIGSVITHGSYGYKSNLGLQAFDFPASLVIIAIANHVIEPVNSEAVPIGKIGSLVQTVQIYRVMYPRD